MTRIFLTLALFASCLVVADLLLGHTIFGYGNSAREYAEILQELESSTPDTKSPTMPTLEKRRDDLRAVFLSKQQRMVLHFWIGIGSVLITMLVNSVCITYFIGTNRWCREVVETYELDPALLESSNALKRQTFPWSFVGILSAIAIAAFGAAADPAGYLRNEASNWVWPHYICSLMGTGIIIGCFTVQVRNIQANYEIIHRILAKVQNIRQANGA
ncbi:MAG: hypothetical protein VX346_00325 [Planctomycetota bacterium]|nr:hypothetical protein [Planctomycetota bacterium]